MMLKLENIQRVETSTEDCRVLFLTVCSSKYKTTDPLQNAWIRIVISIWPRPMAQEKNVKIRS